MIKNIPTVTILLYIFNFFQSDTEYFKAHYSMSGSFFENGKAGIEADLISISGKSSNHIQGLLLFLFHLNSNLNNERLRSKIILAITVQLCCFFIKSQHNRSKATSLCPSSVYNASV